MATRRLALFDVDGTLCRWNLVFVLFEHLVKRGIFPPEALEQTLDAYMGWLNREKSFSEYDKKATQIFHTYAAGLPESKVHEVADEIVNNKIYKVYRYTVDLFNRLQNEGYYTVFISGSPGFIVKKLAAKLGCDRAYGMLYEVIDGKYTGNIRYGEDSVDLNYPLDKTAILKRLEEVLPFTPDLEGSVAVGDSLSDLPILEYVGNPIAFNPNANLAQIARDRKWRIIVERKDVIYEIKDFKMINIETI